MAVSASDIARLRRWINEADDVEPWTDAELETIVERYPLTDERGVDPYYYDTATNPPTQVAVTGWYPTYDLHAAAAEIWDQKGALKEEDVDYTSSDGGLYRHSQKREYCEKQARLHKSQASPESIRLIASPTRNRRGDSVIGNLAEQD